MSDVPDRLLTADELAARWNVPVSWIRQKTRDQAIPCTRFGRRIRFDWNEVEAWRETQRIGPRVA